MATKLTLVHYLKNSPQILLYQQTCSTQDLEIEEDGRRQTNT